MLEQNNNPKEEDGVSSEAKAPPKNSRRSFLTKVAIAAPILTTIAARPVWAGECSLSGNLSNNVSNHGDTSHCEFNGYSNGGWKEGHAENNGYWDNINKSKGDSLSSLLGITPDINATIGNALGDPDANIPNDKGLWKQRAAAALNLCLWEAMKECAQEESCNVNFEFSNVHDDFFFDTTLAIIMDSSEGTLEAANEALGDD